MALNIGTRVGLCRHGDSASNMAFGTVTDYVGRYTRELYGYYVAHGTGQLYVVVTLDDGCVLDPVAESDLIPLDGSDDAVAGEELDALVDSWGTGDQDNGPVNDAMVERHESRPMPKPSTWTMAPG